MPVTNLDRPRTVARRCRRGRPLVLAHPMAADRCLLGHRFGILLAAVTFVAIRALGRPLVAGGGGGGLWGVCLHRVGWAQVRVRPHGSRLWRACGEVSRVSRGVDEHTIRDTHRLTKPCNDATTYPSRGVVLHCGGRHRCGFAGAAAPEGASGGGHASSTRWATRAGRMQRRCAG